MLTEKQIEDNKKTYTELLRSTKREGVEELIAYLNTTDFFIAPASTKYHGAFKGGLCYHCLCVYNVLQDIVGSHDYSGLTEANVIIASLLHDLSKINLYTEAFFNKKVYSDKGTKFDEGGKFDWVSEKGYKLVDDDSRFVYGNHEETAEFIARQFVDLEMKESIAILHHHGSLGWDSTPKETISPVYTKCKLALFLHVADLVSAYNYA